MPLGTIASVLSIASGVKNLFGGGSGGTVSSAAQQAADPFAPYRAGLGRLYASYLMPSVTTAPSVAAPTTTLTSTAIPGGLKVGDWIADGDNSRYATQADVNALSPTTSLAPTGYDTSTTAQGVFDPTSVPGYGLWKTGVLDPAMQAVMKQAAASGRAYSGAEAMGLTDVAGRGYYGFMTDYLNRLAQGSGAVQNPAPAAGLGIDAAQTGWKSIGQGLGGLAGYFGTGGETVGYTPWGSSTVSGVVPGGYTTGGVSYNNPSAYVGTYTPFETPYFGGSFTGDFT